MQPPLLLKGVRCDEAVVFSKKSIHSTFEVLRTRKKIARRRRRRGTSLNGTALSSTPKRIFSISGM